LETFRRRQRGRSGREFRFERNVHHGEESEIRRLPERPRFAFEAVYPRLVDREEGGQKIGVHVFRAA